MDLLQLQYFECIAKHKNVSKAAVELCISQPSLSSSLLRLEKELGQPLFYRTSRGMLLTNYGEFFLSSARQILGIIQTVKLPYPDDLSTRLSIGFKFYEDSIFQLVTGFQQEHPHVQLKLYGSTLGAPFAYSTFDFTVGNAKTYFPVIMNHIRIKSQNYYVVLPKAHPLAGQETLNITDLKDEPMCFLHDTDGNFEYAHSFFVSQGMIPRCVFSTNHAYYKYRYMTTSQNALTITPNGWLKPYQECEHLSVIPLNNYENMTDVLLYWVKDIPLSATAELFLTYIQDHCLD